MKYFGNKSVSSFMAGLLRVSWHPVFITALIAPFAMGGIIFFTTPAGEKVVSAIEKGEINLCDRDHVRASGELKKEFGKDFTEKDKRDWEEFKNLPLAVKFVMIPYAESVLVLLLLVIGKYGKLLDTLRFNFCFCQLRVIDIDHHMERS